MEDREELGACEVCSNAILEGDAHVYTSDGCWLCEDHAPMLSDAIEQHEEMYAAGEENFCNDHYDSFEEMALALLRMNDDLQKNGDRSLAKP